MLHGVKRRRSPGKRSSLMSSLCKMTYCLRLHLRHQMRTPLRTLKNMWSNCEQNKFKITWNVFNFFISNVYIYFWRAHWLISKNSKFRVSNLSTIFWLKPTQIWIVYPGYNFVLIISDPYLMRFTGRCESIINNSSSSWSLIRGFCSSPPLSIGSPSSSMFRKSTVAPKFIKTNWSHLP